MVTSYSFRENKPAISQFCLPIKRWSKVIGKNSLVVVVVVELLFYVHGKHLRSCQDGQLT